MAGQGSRPLLSRLAQHAGEQPQRVAGAAPAPRDACSRGCHHVMHAASPLLATPALLPPPASTAAGAPRQRPRPRHGRVPHARRQEGRQGGGQPGQHALQGGGGVFIRLQRVCEV